MYLPVGHAHVVGHKSLTIASCIVVLSAGLMQLNSSIAQTPLSANTRAPYGTKRINR
jgi:hypothetical protein